MNNQEFDLAGLVTRLCNRYGAVDLAALRQTPQFQAAYASEQSHAPGASAASLVGKALRAMAYVTQNNVTLNAHIIDPRNVETKFDKDEGKTVLSGLGVLIALPDGGQRDIHFADLDPLKEIGLQVPAAGWIPNAKPADPVTLTGVTVSEDLTDGTTRIKLSKDSKVSPGGHTAPFPEGPDLEYLIGKTAEEKGYGAWKIDKRFGTIRGRFGDNDYETEPAVLTITNEVKDIKVNDFEKDFDGNEVAFADFTIQAPCQDRRGNWIQPKLSLSRTLDQLGIGPATPKDIIAARLRGQRILVRGQGCITAQFDPTDVGTELFTRVVKELETNGALASYGAKKDAVRLNLNAVPPTVDNLGNETRRKSIPFGDKQAYDIVQKKNKAGGESWEVSFLCRDVKRLPWMSVMEGKARQNRANYNAGGFFQFLEGAQVELPQNDPFMQLALQMS